MGWAHDKKRGILHGLQADDLDLEDAAERGMRHPWRGQATGVQALLRVRQRPSQVPAPGDIQVPFGVLIRERHEKIARADPRIAGGWGKGERQHVSAGVARVGKSDRSKGVIIALPHGWAYASHRKKQG